MKEEKEIILCQGFTCPLRETCVFYCPTMDLNKTVHWGIMPYNERKKSCEYYKEDGLKNIIDQINNN